MTVDDGFAGGVCRCSGCGTIQTVPVGAAQMVGATSGEVIFEKPGRVGSNLDELGQIVSSSGLAGSGLVSNQRHLAQPPTNRIIKPAAIGGIIALLLAVGVLIGLSLRGSSEVPTKSPSTIEQNNSKSDEVIATAPPKSDDAGKPVPTPRSKVKNEPDRAASNITPTASIDDIDFSKSKVVIFLFDRGEATRPFVNPLRRSALGLAEKLGEGRKFQIIYWTARSVTPLAPEVPQPPSQATIEETRTQLADVAIPRSTDIEPALEIALEGEPTDLIIASAKGWQLDEEFAKLVIDSAKPKSIRVHTIAFSNGPEAEALRQIASETGGQFVIWK